MKKLQRGLLSLIGFILAFAGTVAAQHVVVAGTGDPNLDIPALRAAGSLMPQTAPALGGEPLKTSMEWASEGTALLDAGNYPAAIKAFRQALTVAAASGATGRNLAAIVGSLASAYSDAGQYAESEREWRHALAILERTEGRESLDYALLLGSLSALPTRTENREETIAILRKALTVHGQTGRTTDLAVVREYLVQLLMDEKKYGEAEFLLLDSRTDFARLRIAAPRVLAEILNDLGVIRFSQRRFAESVDQHRESLRVLEGAIGAEHPTLLVPLNNLAASLVKMGRVEDAGAIYRRASKVCGKTLGEDHPTCGVILENYAFVLRKLGRKREAKEMTLRSGQILQASSRRSGVGSVVNVGSLR